MITTNKRIRFCENNFLPEAVLLSFSSELSDFPFENALSDHRTEAWIPEGNFSINASNQKLYIDDGAQKTITIDVGNYSAATLAAEIQTKLNASSTAFTVSYEDDFVFKIENTSSVKLEFSNQTNAVWDVLGFTQTVDETGTSFLAGEVRIHTSEHATFDIGSSFNCPFFAMVSDADEVFPLSTNASVKIYGNSINDFSAPAYEKTIPVTEFGCFSFDDENDTAFRYWKVEIVDRKNSEGISSIRIGNIYLGDYRTLESRNLQNGFEIQFVDNSKQTEASNGALFFDSYTKYFKISNSTLGFLEESDRETVIDIFRKVGKTKPFYISLDPAGCFSSNLHMFTKIVVFDADVSFSHIINGIFSATISMREAV